MLQPLRQLLMAMRQDPKTANELGELPSLATRSLVWMAVVELISIASNYPFSWLINSLPNPNSQSLGLDHINTLVAIVALAASLRLAQGITERYMNAPRNFFIERAWTILEAAGQRHLHSLGYAWNVQHGTGEKESLLAKNHRKLMYLIEQVVFVAIPITFRVCFITIGMWIINWRFGLVISFMVTAYLLIVRFNLPALREMREDYRAYEKRVEELSSTMTNQWSTIQDLGLQPWATGKHQFHLDAYYAAELPRHWRWSGVLLRQEYVLALGIGLAMLATWSSYADGVSIGGLALAMAWFERASSNLYRIPEILHSFHQGGQALPELTKFFSTEPEVKNIALPKWPQQMDGNIQIKGVSLDYGRGSGKPAVDNVSLEIPAFATVAFAGHSGSGKSSLAKLIQRNYDPTAGHILVDGIDLRELDVHRYHSQAVAVVSQHVQLFPGSLRENIAVGRHNASATEIEAAAHQAHVTEFTQRLPGGLDAEIGENGITLSGGQRQRLALARALVRQAPILMLDEATSALDPLSESFIKETLDRMTAEKRCTIIMIAHRFSTIRNADIIFAMKNGRVVEQGTHNELLAQRGYYWQLHEEGGGTGS